MSDPNPALDALLTAKIHYQQTGTTGPRILLVHPIGFDHHSWDEIIPFFKDNYQILALDLPGHGQSDKPADADYSIPSLAHRVLQFLDEVGWQDATWIGNSIGGGVSLAAVLEAPERVKALVLLNSVGFLGGMPRLLGWLAHIPITARLAGYTPSFALRWGLRFGRSGWARAGDELCLRTGQYLRAPEGRSAFFLTLRQLYGESLGQMSPRYGEIQCPTLLLHGAHDLLIPYRHSEQLARAIPHSQLIRLPRCGHFPQEEDPEAVAKEIMRWLDG